MQPDTLSEYLNEVDSRVRSLQNCYIEKYEEEILTPHRANLGIRIRFSTGYLLELNEAVFINSSGELNHLSYRYHFQDKDNKLIFRYDNAPHFPNLKTFPHHKHLPNKVTDVPKPTVLEVIDEIKGLV